MKPHPILSTSFLSGYRNNPPLFFTLKSNFSFKSHGILSLSPVITSCSLSLPSAIFSLKPRSVIKFAPRLTRLLCSSVLAHQATATLNPELAALPDDLIQQGPKLVFRTTRREGAKTVFRWATRAASRDRIKGEKSQEIESISASAASRANALEAAKGSSSPTITSAANASSSANEQFSTAELELRMKLMQEDSELQKLHKQFVGSGVLTESEFWATWKGCFWKGKQEEYADPEDPRSIAEALMLSREDPSDSAAQKRLDRITRMTEIDDLRESHDHPVVPLCIKVFTASSCA
ncbi:hypothetical protein ACLB2K_068493 [Fragaria x ananassa]